LNKNNIDTFNIINKLIIKLIYLITIPRKIKNIYSIHFDNSGPRVSNKSFVYGMDVTFGKVPLFLVNKNKEST